jgi:hypothetical protein
MVQSERVYSLHSPQTPGLVLARILLSQLLVIRNTNTS